MPVNGVNAMVLPQMKHVGLPIGEVASLVTPIHYSSSYWLVVRILIKLAARLLSV
jgi:hypothetical protein